MKIGEFRHRISVRKPVVEVSENGFEVEAYETYKTLWAKVANLHGKEYFEAAAIQKEKTVKFIVRAIKSIDENMKIEFNGKLYNITFIDNIKYENKYMEIKALEVDDDG
ncbi:phage head closure protein [Clostridium thermarum]|uniref:phage head closure protein n=1 Tax=Clostridium thermarum TaxID=1716543 RepID=UPI001121608C|nr:phage head closure protein [Clostridium thermarum]